MKIITECTYCGEKITRSETVKSPSCFDCKEKRKAEYRKENREKLLEIEKMKRDVKKKYWRNPVLQNQRIEKEKKRINKKYEKNRL
jgi:hypothetical protein